MKWNLLATDNSYNWLILRNNPLSVVILAHGVQKTFGWFNGFGWEQSMNYFTGHVGLPAAMAALVILISHSALYCSSSALPDPSMLFC